jgi:hypothetical protein
VLAGPHAGVNYELELAVVKFEECYILVSKISTYERKRTYLGSSAC